VAALGLLVTMQCHVLGVALVPPIVGLWVAAWRSTPGRGRGDLVRAGLGGVAIVLLGYLPLVAYELGHDFVETRAALEFVAAGGTRVSLNLPARLLFVGLRILAWPLTGLLTNGLAIGVVTGVLVATGLAWRAGRWPGRERTAARWLGATLIFGWLVLTFGVAGLATVTPLPTDYYHAFLDPVVFVALGLGVAAVWRTPGRDAVESGPAAGDAAVDDAARDVARGDDVAVDARGIDAAPSPDDAPLARPALPARPTVVARASLVGVLLILLAWNVAGWPPLVAADGGWPAARVAAERIERAAGPRTIRMVGLPAFKSAEAYGFPLERDGRTVVEHLAPGTDRDTSSPVPDPAAAVVIVCDSLFVGDCGGPAEEESLVGAWPVRLRLVDRWRPAPGRTISVYLPSA
jgi:hypothetical protein